MRTLKVALLGLPALAALFFRSGPAKQHTRAPVPEPVERRLRQGSGRNGQGLRIVPVALLVAFGLALALLGGSSGQGASALQPSAQPSTEGEWSAPMDWPLIGIHAALLPTGKVLHYSWPRTAPGAEAWTWDPETGTLAPALTSRYIFCSSQSFLPDGRLLVTGGTDPLSPPFTPYGTKDINIFDPSTETWTYAGDMQVGRWYPTNVALPDGRTLVFSGLDEQSNLTDVVEVYDPSSGMQVVPGANKLLALYPRMHVLPSGKVFHAGPENVSSTFDPATATWEAVAFTQYGYRNGGGLSTVAPAAA